MDLIKLIFNQSHHFFCDSLVIRACRLLKETFNCDVGTKWCNYILQAYVQVITYVCKHIYVFIVCLVIKCLYSVIYFLSTIIT